MLSLSLGVRDRDTYIHIYVSVPAVQSPTHPRYRGPTVPPVTLGDAVGRLMEFCLLRCKKMGVSSYGK